MKKLTVALLADGLYTWDGGVDYLSNIAGVLEYVDKNWSDYSVDTYLIIPREAFIFRLFRKIFKKGNDEERIAKTISVFKTINKNVKIVYYHKTIKKLYDDHGKNLNKVLNNIKADICLPVLRAYYPALTVPWIAYIPDLQEKYLAHLFPSEELSIRDRMRRAQVDNSRFFVATSRTVKEDIEKFYPSDDVTIYDEPFAPVAAEEFIDTSEVNVDSYNLPEKFFIISNQFWAHKSHDTAIRAIKMLVDEGLDDVYLLITGKMDSDPRNDNYSNKVRNLVNELNLTKNVRFLGFIPKLDQIEIMKRSVALIQPSLFEGDPGGCSVFNANSLGIRSIMTDIPVNLEAQNDPLVTIFKAENYVDLADKMKDCLGTERSSPTVSWIRENNNAKSKILADFYINMINDVIDKY